MAQPQVKPREFPSRRRRDFSGYMAQGNSSSSRLDSSTLASTFQLKEEQRELTYSFIALFIKSGLLLIAIASSLKLGLASHQRINRNNEIALALWQETQKLERLSLRFDSLFALGGKERLMEEQDQWIAPKSKRIIWR